MAGSANGNHHGTDLSGDAQLIAGVQLERQGRSGGAGPQCSDGRRQDILEEVLYAPGTGCQKRVQRQKHKEIHDGGRIVDQQSPRIALEQLRAVGSRQIGKVRHQANGGQLHQQRDHFVKHQ